ncbi:hypothetical protein F5Y06DRAFT_300599 [Hypoxylon sp. FL0890]|nr:hypothetical protein F5Y06DRAFT_300599 [Hypoxylon sp. FL0890]
MAAMGYSGTETGQIKKLTEECDIKFQNLSTTNSTKCRDAINTQHKSFRIWIASIGALASPKASLDQRLKEHGHIKLAVVELLVLVKNCLENEPCKTLSSPAKGEGDEDDSRPVIGQHSVLEEALKCLHQMAASIRRASVPNSKFDLSARFPKTNRVFDPSFEENAKRLVKYKFPSAAGSLREQLSTAMAHRRNWLEYKYRHAQKMSQHYKHGQTNQNNLTLGTPGQIEDPPSSTSVSQKNQLPSANPPPPRRRNLLLSDTTASKPSVSRRHMNWQAPSSVNSTRRGRFLNDDACHYPPIPSIYIETGFCLCPYCFISLPTKELTESYWKRHFDEDIQPFVCLSESCHDPLQFFPSLHRWEEHMDTQHSSDWTKTIHSTAWRCDVDECQSKQQHDIFYSRTTFKEHIRSEHMGKYSEAQISALAVQKKTKAFRKAHVCPLCEEEISTDSANAPSLVDHVGGHLHYLASICVLQVHEPATQPPPSLEPPDEGGEPDNPFNGSSCQRYGRKESIASDFKDLPTDLIDESREQKDGQDITESNLKFAFSTARPVDIDSWRRDLYELLHRDNTSRSDGDRSDNDKREVNKSNHDKSDDDHEMLLDNEATLSKNLTSQEKLIRTKIGGLRKPFSLADTERVRIVLDRGDGDIRASAHISQHHDQSETFRPIPGEIDRLLETIGKELDTSKITSALDSNKEYIPRHKLTEILTPARVRTIVGQPYLKDYTDKDRLTEDICSGSTPRLKLLAVLIGIDRTTDFPRLMKDGMHDQCLPMELETPPQKRLYCPHHKTYHSTVNSYPRPKDRDEFSRWSYSLNAPYIKYNKEKHSHYILHPSDVFPMEIGWKIQRDGELTNYGGYSEVYKVKINESHYNFANAGIRHPSKFFALKRLHSRDQENFNLELSSLLFSMNKASGKGANNHLIHLLATFEVPHPSMGGSTYYLLFDWAEGNLRDFWRSNPNLVGEKHHSLWMSQQFHRICQAVQCVHNEREETLKSTDTSRLARGPERQFDVHDLYGRHGDIKPDNFLWFHPAYPSSDLLALSDFGLGRLHTQVSRSNQDPRKLAYTATYIAPEFDLPDSMISRASDIFSLGCVFLEYVTWYMKGLDSVENEFPIQRSSKDMYGFDADKFFVIRPDGPGGQHRPFLKPRVKEWIAALQQHENCTWYLHQLLEIIRDKMLEPDRNKRIHIIPLIKEMEKLRKTCERDDSFYLKTIKES